MADSINNYKSPLFPLSSNQSSRASSNVHLNLYSHFANFFPQMLVDICSFLTLAGQIYYTFTHF